MNRQGFPRRRLHRMALLGALAIAVPAIAACGSSSSGAVSAPVIGAAKTFSLAGFDSRSCYPEFSNRNACSSFGHISSSSGPNQSCR